MSADDVLVLLVSFVVGIIATFVIGLISDRPRARKTHWEICDRYDNLRTVKEFRGDCAKLEAKAYVEGLDRGCGKDRYVAMEMINWR